MLSLKKLTWLCSLLLSNTAWATCSLPVAKPDSRYTVVSNSNGSGEVQDGVTGLIWQRCVLGKTWDGVSSCNGTAVTATWEGALNYAKLNNANGWRLPNIKELASLADYACAPAINTVFFPMVRSVTDDVVVWSSSGDVSIGANAWNFIFSYGDTSSDPKSSFYAIRLVRD